MEWIDRRKELPSEDGMLVVVFDPSNHPTVWPAKWSAENKSFDSNGGWFEADEIIYWMPLPKAPKSPWWCEGFAAAEKEEANHWPDEYTHNPYELTSPWVYPDAHCGPPTRESSEWTAEYEYYVKSTYGVEIRLQITTLGATFTL